MGNFNDAELNEFGQGVGALVPNWNGAKPPSAVTLTGRYVTLRPLEVDDAGALFACLAGEEHEPLWTYRVERTPQTVAELADQIRQHHAGPDLVFAVVPNDSGQPLGRTSLLRIDPANGVAEIGAIHYAPALQRTRAATEATCLLLAYLFDELGFRRVEWKCNRLNQPSKRAAERLGFQFEGTFRHALVSRGRNRDTDWYAMLAADWTVTKSRLATWLDPANFDAAGQQLTKLGE